jgi:hypothetical protein
MLGLPPTSPRSTSSAGGRADSARPRRFRSSPNCNPVSRAARRVLGLENVRNRPKSSLAICWNRVGGVTFALKPLKATQSHTKATLKPTDSQPKATQSHTKAAQSHTKAPTKPHQSQVQARCLGGDWEVQARYMRGPSQVQARFKPGDREGTGCGSVPSRTLARCMLASMPCRKLSIQPTEPNVVSSPLCWPLCIPGSSRGLESANPCGL